MSNEPLGIRLQAPPNKSNPETLPAVASGYLVCPSPAELGIISIFLSFFLFLYLSLSLYATYGVQVRPCDTHTLPFTFLDSSETQGEGSVILWAYSLPGAG